MAHDSCYARRYDFIGNLNYNFTEVPKWRENSKEKTQELLVDIVDFYRKYEGLPPSTKAFCTTTFAKLMREKFVFNANIGESVGIQTSDGTRTVLEDYIDNQLSSDSAEQSTKTKDDLVTINIYKALLRFDELHKDMSRTGNLTVQQVCDVHGVLMTGVHQDAGKTRINNTYVTWNNEDYFYPEAREAGLMFDACIDHHTTHMTQYEKNLAKEAPSVEAFGYLFKCAARLLFDFVDAHPFGDGNGRMCRLLANYVLSLITPFPVVLYSSGEGRSGREDYLNAIVECRDHRDKGPGTLAAMLVEGTWRGWKSLFRILKENNFLNPTKVIGPIVVRKSDDRQDTIKKVVESLKRFDVEHDSLEHVTRAIDETHEASENDAATGIVQLSEKVELHLHIYA